VCGCVGVYAYVSMPVCMKMFDYIDYIYVYVCIYICIYIYIYIHIKTTFIFF
jgi:hypothetical protein